MRKLSAKWVPNCMNVDQKSQRCQSSEQHLGFFRRDPNDLLSRLLTMDETWLYHYEPETKQQSMGWRHSGSTRSQKFRVQNSAGKFLASIFWGKTAFSALIIFQRAKLSTRNINHLYWCNWRTFEGKTSREVHQGGLFLARHCPGSPDTCNPEVTDLPGLPCLDHTLYSLDLTPSDYHLFPGLKNNWKVTAFRPTRRSLLSRRPGWTDNLLNYF